MVVFPRWVDAVEKRFEGSVRATSIQKMSGKRNIDSNNHLPGFDCCALGVRRRLFQQHRPIAASYTRVTWPGIDFGRQPGLTDWDSKNPVCGVLATIFRSKQPFGGRRTHRSG